MASALDERKLLASCIRLAICFVKLAVRRSLALVSKFPMSSACGGMY